MNTSSAGDSRPEQNAETPAVDSAAIMLTKGWMRADRTTRLNFLGDILRGSGNLVREALLAVESERSAQTKKLNRP